MPPVRTVAYLRRRLLDPAHPGVVETVYVFEEPEPEPTEADVAAAIDDLQRFGERVPPGEVVAWEV